jgi:hypothetical protein
MVQQEGIAWQGNEECSKAQNLPSTLSVESASHEGEWFLSLINASSKQKGEDTRHDGCVHGQKGDEAGKYGLGGFSTILNASEQHGSGTSGGLKVWRRRPATGAIVGFAPGKLQAFLQWFVE